MFPEELPKRIIKMFSFVGETVLDPFLGSGTTLKVALSLNRNCIGYEINPNFLEIIKKKVEIDKNNVDIIHRKNNNLQLEEISEYTPNIQDANPVIEPDKLKFNGDKLYKVIEILQDGSLKLDTGLVVKFRGIKLKKEFMEEIQNYLKEKILGKKVFLKFDKNYVAEKESVEAYIYLKNKIFINTYLIKSNLAEANKEDNYDMKKKFIDLENKHKEIVTYGN